MNRDLDVQVAEVVMGLVPCQAESHTPGHKLYAPRPCHARPDSQDRGAETQMYSTDWNAAMDVRDKVASQTFSIRHRFNIALQQIISERAGMDLHPVEIMLRMTAEDVCRAAVEAMTPEV